MQGSTSKSSKSTYLKKLWSTQVFFQQPLAEGIAILILVLSLKQLFFLMVKNAFLVILQSDTELYKEVSTFQKFVIGNRKMSINPFKTWESLIIGSTLFYCFLLWILILLLIYKVRRERPLPHVLKQIWLPICYIHHFVLFLPVQSILIDLINQLLEENFKSIHWKYELLTGLGIFSLIINFAFSLTQLRLSLNLKTKDPFSRTNDYLIIIWFIHKTLSGILSHFAMNNPDWKNYWTWIVTWINFVCSLLSVYLFYRTLPFYKRSLLKVSVFFNGAFFTISSLNLVFLIINGAYGKVTTYMYLLLQICLIPIFIRVFYNIYKRLELTLNSYLTLKPRNTWNSFWEAQAIHLIKKCTFIFPNVNIKDKLFSEEILLELSYKKYYAAVEGEEAKSWENKAFLKEFLDDILENSRPSSLSLLIIANIYLKKCHHFTRAYTLCNKVLATSNTRMSEKLSALMIISQIEKTLIKLQLSSSQKVDLVRFMKAMENYNNIGQLIEKQLDAREEFYHLLENETPCLYKISKLSHKIQKLQKETRDLWDSLPAKSLEEYPPLLKIYALFSIFADLQHEKGKI